MNKKTLLLAIVGLTAFALILGLSPAHKIFARDRGENGGNGLTEEADDRECDNASAIGQVIRNKHADSEDSAEDTHGTAESANVKPNGDFRVTGVTVNSVSGSILNVSLFGVSKSVDVGNARIIGAGNSITIADIHPGDKLTGSGNFNETSKVVTVVEISDVSFANQNTAGIKAKIQQLWDLIQQLQEQLKKVL